MSLDNVKIDELSNLMDKKKILIREGKVTELIRLKKLYPDLFDAEKEKEIKELIHTCEYISNTPHFKAMLREEQKKKLIPVDFDCWKSGMLDEVLKQHTTIKHADIYSISRVLVKESIAICFEQCGIKDNTKINEVLPFMGILIKEVLMQFPIEKQSAHLSRVLYKLRVGTVQNEKIDDALEEQASFNDQACENRIKESFQNLLKKILYKFDKRVEWYADSLFFCLVEVSDFVHLLATNISENSGAIIKQIESKLE